MKLRGLGSKGPETSVFPPGRDYPVEFRAVEGDADGLRQYVNGKSRRNGIPDLLAYVLS